MLAWIFAAVLLGAMAGACGHALYQRLKTMRATVESFDGQTRVRLTVSSMNPEALGEFLTSDEGRLLLRRVKP